MIKKGFAVCYYGWWYMNKNGMSLRSQEAFVFDTEPEAQKIADKIHGVVTRIELMTDLEG